MQLFAQRDQIDLNNGDEADSKTYLIHDLVGCLSVLSLALLLLSVQICNFVYSRPRVH